MTKTNNLKKSYQNKVEENYPKCKNNFSRYHFFSTA